MVAYLVEKNQFVALTEEKIEPKVQVIINIPLHQSHRVLPDK